MIVKERSQEGPIEGWCTTILAIGGGVCNSCSTDRHSYHTMCMSTGMMTNIGLVRFSRYSINWMGKMTKHVVFTIPFYSSLSSFFSLISTVSEILLLYELFTLSSLVISLYLSHQTERSVGKLNLRFSNVHTVQIRHRQYRPTLKIL